jgi:hypothetical protein
VLASAVGAAVLGATLPSACKGTPGVDVGLQDSGGLRSAAAFAEVLVYDGGCPGLDQLSRGVEGDPKVRRVVAASADLPDLGDLSRASYGVAVLLRDAHCAVIASGCADADLTSVRKVTIPVAPVQPPQGACAAGAACVDAICVGGGDAGATDAGPSDAGADAAAHDAGPVDSGGGGGAGGGGPACTLALVKAGALPSLATPGGGTITGPGVTPVDGGFLLAYREGSADQSQSLADLLKIGDDGVAGAVSRQPVPTCAGSVAADGVGVAESGGSGLVVVTRPACQGAGAGLSILSFDASFTLAAAAPSLDLGAAVSMARVHGIAARKGGFEVPLVIDGTATLATIGAGSITKQAFFADGTSTFAEVALTPSMRATLADRAGSGLGETVMTLGPIDAPPPDAGVPPAVTAHRGASPWGALTAWSTPAGDRAAAVTVEQDGSLTWGAVDRAGLLRGAGNVSPGDASVFSAGDVAVLGDRVVIAIGQPLALQLQKLRGALGDALAAEGPPVAFSGAVGAVGLGSFDGARVAIAAARKRVFVAWISRNQLAPTDPTGGWALFSCGE